MKGAADRRHSSCCRVAQPHKRRPKDPSNFTYSTSITMATKHRSTGRMGQLPIRVKGHTKCPYHKDNDVVLLCKDCGTLICTTCSITTHKTHIDSFYEISKISNQQKNILKDFINETENIKILKIKTEIQSTKAEISTCESNYKKLSVDIKKQRDQCKQDLDRITEDYLAICDKIEKGTTNLLQSHIKNLEDRLDTLVKLSSECKQTLQTGTAVLVYDSVSEIQDMDLDIPQTPNIDMPEFTPCNNRQSHMEQAMGIMKNPTDHLQGGSVPRGHATQGQDLSPKLSPKTRKTTETGQDPRAVMYNVRHSPTVISQFPYRDDFTSICPTPDGCAWLCAYDTNTVKLINNKGKVIQKLAHQSNISDIGLDPTTGRLWFCCISDRTIHEVFTSSTPVTRFTTEGYPASLCVTREGRVVVGNQGTDGYNLVMYTNDGQMLHRATVERSGTGLVRFITQCGVTGNIAVVNSKLISGDDSDPNNYRCHIVVYNPTLQPLFHYRGEGIQGQKAVTPDTFDPCVVVYDSKGNIVIADRTRNTLELISGTGKYIKTLHTNKGSQGLVGITKDDVLWSYLQLDTGEWGLKILKYYSD